MFRRRQPSASPVALIVDGAPVGAEAGDSVAAALLLAGISPFRTTAVSGAPRAPYCMIGHCFDCLVEIDGEPNRQACLEIVHEGMQVRRQHGAVRVVP